jgi:diadenosine tetraphosphate (Ap4A) HIT family hydrolase
LGQSSDVVCQSCELSEKRDAGDTPLWDNILRTPNWDLVHSYNSSIEGWLVLVTRRHVEAVADLTDEEAEELGPLIKRVSQALHAATGCVKTYVVQFAEAPLHNHVHVHVVARYADQSDDLKGPGVFSALGVDDNQAVSEDRRNELAQRVRDHLLQR